MGIFFVSSENENKLSGTKKFCDATGDFLGKKFCLFTHEISRYRADMVSSVWRGRRNVEPVSFDNGS